MPSKRFWSEQLWAAMLVWVRCSVGGALQSAAWVCAEEPRVLVLLLEVLGLGILVCWDFDDYLVSYISVHLLPKDNSQPVP